MVAYGIFSVFVFVAGNIALTCGHSLVCHYCNSVIHGADCHDPINTTTSTVGQQSCSDFAITMPSKTQRHDDDEPAMVCYTLSYKNENGILVTIRGCEFELYDDKHVCTFYEEDITGNPVLDYTEFNCTACSTDFCNSSSTVYAYVTILMFGIFVLMFC